MKTLTQNLQNKTATIGIIGLGYVGLPLALRFSEVGFKTIGFDIDQEKVNQLQRGQSFIKHIAAEDIKAANSNGLSVTTDFTKAKDADALIICVPTPLNLYREPDLYTPLQTRGYLPLP